MNAHRRLVIGAATLGVARALAARAQTVTLPPIRPLGPVVARTTIDLGDVQTVRVLSDGRILVNSPKSRRVLLIDSTLATARAIVGPPGSGVPEYAQTAGALLAARADSSFLINGPSKIDVIEPAGKVVRSIPLPRGNPGTDLLAPALRALGDRQGRILMIPPPPFFLSLAEAFVGDTIVSAPEFVPLLRFDPTTQRMDTVATLRGPRRRQGITRWENGGRGVPAQDPFPLIGDDWAVLSDGTIAIARLSGYSVDEIAPGRGTISGPPVAHTWTAIPPARKAAIMDSVKVARNAARADSAFPSDSARYDSLSLVEKANPEALTDADGKRISLGPRPVRLQFVAPADLPDSMPPFAPGGMIADADDNLWIQNYLPARPGGGIVYDVVNRKGTLVDRVELALGTTLLGFTPGFAVLRVGTGRDAAIARARLR